MLRVTCAGSNGTALKGGPRVATICPEYRSAFGPLRPADIDSHHALPVASYVNHVAKIDAPWCAKLMPQPDSEPAGAFHQRPCACTLVAAVPLTAATTAAPASMMPAPHVSIEHRHSSCATGFPDASNCGALHAGTPALSPVAGNGRAVDCSTSRACCAVSDGCTESSSATVPATSG